MHIKKEITSYFYNGDDIQFNDKTSNKIHRKSHITFNFKILFKFKIFSL